jgi:uncharacterized protein (TIGR03435 family)
MQKPYPVKRRLLLAAALLVPAVHALARPAVLAQVPASSDTPAAPYEWVLISTVGFPASIRQQRSRTMTSNRQTLRRSIAFAYDVDPFRVIGGPGWLDQRLYYITARLPPQAPFEDASSTSDESMQADWDQWRSRDQAMLADRFSLRVHRETRVVPGYILTVESGGARVVPVPESIVAMLNHRGLTFKSEQASIPGSAVLTGSISNLVASAVTMKTVAQTVAMWLGAPVVDQTALQGHFDFQIPGTLTGATVVRAFRDQAGLVVEPADTQVDVIVVDGVQRPALNAAGSGTWQMPDWTGREYSQPVASSSGV